MRAKAFRRPAYTTAALLVAALATACGGGSETPVPEAVVQAVGNAQVLEGNTANPSLKFAVTLDKPVVRGLDIVFTTVSTAKSGFASTGSAVGSASCASDVNFISANGSRVSIPVGANTVSLSVVVCANTTFAPNQNLKLNWTSAGSAGGSAIGTIVNDDAGGLNGTGALTVLNGLAAFGRDTNPLSNSDADGARGFAFEQKSSNSNPGCTTDKVTGLNWQVLDTSAGAKDFASLAAYVSSVNATSPCGFADWRVPAVNELVSLMNSSQPVNASQNADRVISGANMTGQFWSSESNVSASNDAWVIDADSGAVSFDAKTNLKKIRLVQGMSGVGVGLCDPGQYTNFGDGTVADKRTGLMWKQCTEGLSGNSCTSGSALPFSTIPAIVSQLNVVNTIGSAEGLGYIDWRVPSKHELASLANRSCTGSPAIVNSIFPATVAVAYASATIDANDSSRLWYVDFFDGTIAVGQVAIPKLVRLVRAGQ